MPESAAVDASVERDAASTRLSVISSTSRDGASPESSRHRSTNATNPGSARCRAETLTCTAHPSAQVTAAAQASSQHLLAERDAQRAAVGAAQEGRGPEQPPLRVRPPHERLPRGDRAAAQVDDRLVVRPQLAALQAFGERRVHGELVGRDRAPAPRSRRRSRPRPLRLAANIERSASCRSDSLLVRVADRHPDARRDPHLVPEHRERPGQLRPGSARPPAPPRRPRSPARRGSRTRRRRRASWCRPPGSRPRAARRPGAGGRRRPRARRCR